MYCCICSVIQYILISAVLLFLAVCLIIKKLTNPYPDLHRTKKEKCFVDPTSGEVKEFPSIDDDHSINLSVVVPSYNEQDRLPSMLDECLSFLEERQAKIKNFKYEVIVVSDGSKDKTVDVAHKYCKKYGSDKVRVLELETNRGKGGAVCSGVQSSRGAVILFADADGATKFADIAKLEAALKELTGGDYIQSSSSVVNEAVIVCGSRAHLEKDAIAHRSLFRNLLMYGFHFLVWLLAVRSLKDTQCGFKLLTRKSARACFRSLHVLRWAFDVELLYIAERLKIPLIEVSVRWTEIEGSKLIPVWSWLQMGLDLFFIWLKYSIGAWKLAN